MISGWRRLGELLLVDELEACEPQHRRRIHGPVPSVAILEAEDAIIVAVYAEVAPAVADVDVSAVVSVGFPVAWAGEVDLLEIVDPHLVVVPTRLHVAHPGIRVVVLCLLVHVLVVLLEQFFVAGGFVNDEDHSFPVTLVAADIVSATQVGFFILVVPLGPLAARDAVPVDGGIRVRCPTFAAIADLVFARELDIVLGLDRLTDLGFVAVLDIFGGRWAGNEAGPCDCHLFPTHRIPL